MDYCLCHGNEYVKTHPSPDGHTLNSLEEALSLPQCIDLLAHHFHNLGHLTSQASTAEEQHVREAGLLGGGRLPLVMAHISIKSRQNPLSD